MKIIKRSGMEDTFDIKKIEAAIRKANESVIDYEKLTEEKIQEILANVFLIDFRIRMVIQVTKRPPLHSCDITLILDPFRFHLLMNAVMDQPHFISYTVFVSHFPSFSPSKIHC
jgi:hypothetical protein